MSPLTRGNQATTREEGPADTSLLSPFPTWQSTAVEEGQDATQTTVSPRVGGRMLRSSESAASSVHSNSASPPPQQPQQPQQSRQHSFNLRDGAREAIKVMKEGAEAKQMIVAEPLYGFYNTEISLHFLHALSAYFIRIAKDISLARQRQEHGADSRGNIDGVDGDQDRMVLLREVGRSYGRVVLYCSNFERTTADAKFFESLLYLARMVVAAAVAEPSMASDIDKEFDRILRGGVFHPTPARPPPRHLRRPRHLSPRQTLAETMCTGDVLGRQSPRPMFNTSSNHHHGRDVEVDNDNGGSGESAEQQQGGGGTFASGARTTNSRRNDRGKRGGSPAPPGRQTRRSATGRGTLVGRVPSSSSHRALFSGGSDGKQRLRGETTVGVGSTQEGERNRDGARRDTSPLPAFDELSRWKVTRGSVSKMVRLAGEAQRMALSNLSLAEECRRAVATKMIKHVSKFTPTTSPNLSTTTTTTTTTTTLPDNIKNTATTPHSNHGTNNTNKTTATGDVTGTTTNPTKPGNTTSTIGSPAAAVVASTGGTSAVGKKAPFRKRGGPLSGRHRRTGGARRGHGSDGQGGQSFFCAETLSVCIASVVNT